jgi:hypothetical protein
MCKRGEVNKAKYAKDRSQGKQSAKVLNATYRKRRDTKTKMFFFWVLFPSPDFPVVK